MNRIYVPEHKQFFTSIGFDLARANGQVNNAMSWYTSNPISSNMDRLMEAHEKVHTLMLQLKKYHDEKLDPQVGHVVDPDRPGENG